MIDSAENYKIQKLENIEHKLKVITEAVMVFHTFQHEYSEDGLASIRESVARNKQRLIELELFLDVNYGKEV
jgi:uncharacterized protein YfkK (UPF0435 family)